jgi:pyridoxine 5-phosphate synthase
MTRLAIEILAGSTRRRVTLVPERPGEVTTEGGLDLVENRAAVGAAVQRFRDEGLGVSLFVDPDERQIHAAAAFGPDMIELNTARYSEAGGRELERLAAATRTARGLGLDVAAGHGLTHHSLPALVEAVPDIVEYNIGHSIVARAIFVGLDRAVRDLKGILA